MQGSSFKTILETGQEPADWQQETYYRYWMHMAHKHNNPAHFGIRTKDYKLIFYYGLDFMDRNTNAQAWAHNPASMSYFQTPAAWEFYDLKNDPHEMDNKYGDETITVDLYTCTITIIVISSVCLYWLLETPGKEFEYAVVLFCWCSC